MMHKSFTHLPLQLCDLHGLAPAPPASVLLRLSAPPCTLLPRYWKDSPDFPLAQLPVERLAIRAQQQRQQRMKSLLLSRLHSEGIMFMEGVLRKGSLWAFLSCHTGRLPQLRCHIASPSTDPGSKPIKPEKQKLLKAVLNTHPRHMQ